MRQVEAAGEFGKPSQRWFAELERQFNGDIMKGTTSPSASLVASFASVTLKAYSHVLEAKNQEAASIMGALLRPPIQLEGERVE